jgi:hypothetical protein
MFYGIPHETEGPAEIRLAEQGWRLLAVDISLDTWTYPIVGWVKRDGKESPFTSFFASDSRGETLEVFDFGTDESEVLYVTLAPGEAEPDRETIARLIRRYRRPLETWQRLERLAEPLTFAQAVAS